MNAVVVPWSLCWKKKKPAMEFNSIIAIFSVTFPMYFKDMINVELLRVVFL